MEDEPLDPAGDGEFEPDEEGGSIVAQLAEYAAQVMSDNACQLATVKGELPDGTTVCVAVGVYRAGEWMNNTVGAECDATPHDPDDEDDIQATD